MIRQELEYDIDEYFFKCGCHVTVNGYGIVLKCDYCKIHDYDLYNTDPIYDKDIVFDFVYKRYRL